MNHHPIMLYVAIYSDTAASQVDVASLIQSTSLPFEKALQCFLSILQCLQILFISQISHTQMLKH